MKGQTGLTVTVTSGNTQLGQASLVEGFNKFSFSGLTTGSVNVKVQQGTSIIIAGTGPISVSSDPCPINHARSYTQLHQVTSSSSLCNFNFQVVGLAA